MFQSGCAPQPYQRHFLRFHYAQTNRRPGSFVDPPDDGDASSPASWSSLTVAVPPSATTFWKQEDTYTEVEERFGERSCTQVQAEERMLVDDQGWQWLVRTLI